jgi:predicted nuclease of predicted toxin-antitoxin system
VKVKLDENLPGRARSIVEAVGIDVDTAEDEGLAGADDGSVGRAATEAGRLLITLDRGFGDVLRYPPGSHAGVLVLRVDDQSVATVCDAVRAVIDSYELDSLEGCVAVYRNGTLRVRRPTSGDAAPES